MYLTFAVVSSTSIAFAARMGTASSKNQLSCVVSPPDGDLGPIRRLEQNKERLMTPSDIDPLVHNVYDLLKRGVRISKNAPCLGTCCFQFLFCVLAYLTCERNLEM